jgi:hypothetical protein
MRGFIERSFHLKFVVSRAWPEMRHPDAAATSKN